MHAWFFSITITSSIIIGIVLNTWFCLLIILLLVNCFYLRLLFRNGGFCWFSCALFLVKSRLVLISCKVLVSDSHSLFSLYGEYLCTRDLLELFFGVVLVEQVLGGLPEFERFHVVPVAVEQTFDRVCRPSPPGLSHRINDSKIRCAVHVLVYMAVPIIGMDSC